MSHIKNSHKGLKKFPRDDPWLMPIIRVWTQSHTTVATTSFRFLFNMTLLYCFVFVYFSSKLDHPKKIFLVCFFFQWQERIHWKFMHVGQVMPRENNVSCPFLPSNQKSKAEIWMWMIQLHHLTVSVCTSWHRQSWNISFTINTRGR